MGLSTAAQASSRDVPAPGQSTPLPPDSGGLQEPGGEKPRAAIVFPESSSLHSQPMERHASLVTFLRCAYRIALSP